MAKIDGSVIHYVCGSMIRHSRVPYKETPGINWPSIGGVYRKCRQCKISPEAPTSKIDSD